MENELNTKNSEDESVLESFEKCVGTEWVKQNNIKQMHTSG